MFPQSDNVNALYLVLQVGNVALYHTLCVKKPSVKLSQWAQKELDYLGGCKADKFERDIIGGAAANLHFERQTV